MPAVPHYLHYFVKYIFTHIFLRIMVPRLDYTNNPAICTVYCSVLATAMVTECRLGTDICTGEEGGSPSDLGKLKSCYIRYFVHRSMA